MFIRKYIVIQRLYKDRWEVIHNPEHVGIEGRITEYDIDQKGYKNYRFTEVCRVKTPNGEAVRYK